MALASFIIMEIFRARSEASSGKQWYENTTQYNFSEEGLRGSSVFRYKGCTSCHRAVRNGTNMGLDLDGIGSKRSLQYLTDFLKTPETTYPTRTVDHGPNKAAAFVAELPESDRHALAVFLSELRAVQGSPAARLPPEGRSGFVDEMVKDLAPEDWKSKHKDVREEAEKAKQKKSEDNIKPSK
ncbi:MAG TPA: c-type cytochrome [Gallionellaceae bacterium]